MHRLIAALSALSASQALTIPTPYARGESRFFLDTADASEWKSLLPLGIFHGVTTNPTLLERAGVPCTVSEVHALAGAAFEAGAAEFMCQAWGGSAGAMYACGRELASFDKANIVVKVPVTAEGCEAAARLVRDEVRVCLTACYTAHQALIAASVGAEYLAPYLGRMRDNGRRGVEEIELMQDIVDGLGSDTRIFVASIRDVESMAELAAAGLDSFTFSPEIARKLFEDPLTQAAAEDFEAAAARGGGGGPA